MAVRDAAIQVLQEAGCPLHVQEITKRIFTHRLWQTEGKTPQRTIAAALYMDIKRNGERSPFVLTEAVTFGLRTRIKSIGRGQRTSNEKAFPTRKQQSKKTFSFTDSAEKILEQYGEKRPMHYRAITVKALELGILDTQGQTPEASMYGEPACRGL